jgi:hypothetical protein
MSIRPSKSPTAVVHVTIDLGGKARLDPPKIRVTPGATVRWRFAGVPAGFFPLIRSAGGRGPFETVCLSGDEVTGVVAADLGDHRYEVVLVPVAGASLRLPPGGAGLVFVPRIVDLEEPPDGGRNP